MIITPFGDLDLDDDVALARWLEAHRERHNVYSQLMKISGGQFLTGEIDGDWMHRHWARHAALVGAGTLDLSSETEGLALPGKWRTERELHDWHELHNRIHLKIEQQLKLSGA